jgi:hypothetical protein
MPTAFEVGKVCPSFKVPHIQGFRHSFFKPEQSKGKWLLLNFFGLSCSSAFLNFPMLDSLYTLNGAELDVVLLGKIDTVNSYLPDIRSEFQQFKDKYGLQVPVAFSASLFDQLNVVFVPYNVLIDPEGKVQEVFYTNRINRTSILDRIRGRIPQLPNWQVTAELPDGVKAFEFGEPLLIGNNGGREDEFKFRSLLTDQLPGIGANPVAVQRGYGNGIQFFNQRLRVLIHAAYGDTTSRLPRIEPNSYGVYHPEPIWDFDMSAKDSIDLLQKLYSYDLRVPQENPDPLWIQQLMQQDLERYFGLDIKVEERLMPAYTIRVIGDKNRVLTKGGRVKREHGVMGKIALQNVPVSDLIYTLWRRYPSDTVFIDATGITGSIDVSIATLENEPLSAAIASLYRNGIEVKLVKWPMKVFVVRRTSSLVLNRKE